MLDMTFQLAGTPPAAGVYNSAAETDPDASLAPQADVPPMARTVPSGRIVAFICRRLNDMEAVAVHRGEASARSMISAVFCGRVGQVSPPPPTYSTFVSSMTAEPYPRWSTLRWGFAMRVLIHAPKPEGSRCFHACSPAWTTQPFFGSTNMRG